MTLVGKSGRDRDFRQRKLGLTKHALRSIQPPAQKVAVRRRIGGNAWADRFTVQYNLVGLRKGELIWVMVSMNNTDLWGGVPGEEGAAGQHGEGEDGRCVSCGSRL